jgi:hypothetical protein
MSSVLAEAALPEAAVTPADVQSALEVVQNRTQGPSDSLRKGKQSKTTPYFFFFQEEYFL